jgi:ectoine hydroxylase-related dioxygenase (phytanoyl-CoA dioxygenase family)
MTKKLSSNQIQQWKEKGYIIVSNLIEPDLLNKCVEFMNRKYPNPDKACKDFGSDNGELEFPSGNIIDWISIHKNIISGVKELLYTDNILLLQSDAWGKAGYRKMGEMSNQDQRMHMDYGNNTFLHPSNWNTPETVANIIYLSDTSDTGGGTSVVPRLGDKDPLYQPPYINMPGQNRYNFYNDRSTAEKYMATVSSEMKRFREKLYQREIITTPKIGDVLFYRLDLWHRGTPVNVGKVRNVINLLWRKKECFWINTWNKGWTKRMYLGIIEKLFSDMTPEQRSVLGIPKPGDKYWDKNKLQLLKARYPNIDIYPYLSKL